jgi:hypothetical protein
MASSAIEVAQTSQAIRDGLLVSQLDRNMVLPKRQEPQHESVTWSLVGADYGVVGVVLTGQLGSATADGTANTMLLPIFAEVFLGGTAFTPSRLNVAGLFVAALFLERLRQIGLEDAGQPIAPAAAGGSTVLRSP